MNQPPGGKRRWLLHSHRDGVPGAVRDRLLAQEADAFDAVPTPDVNKQGGVLNGYLQGIHFFHSPEQNSILIPGSEIHTDAAQSSSH